MAMKNATCITVDAEIVHGLGFAEIDIQSLSRVFEASAARVVIRYIATGEPTPAAAPGVAHQKVYVLGQEPARGVILSAGSPREPRFVLPVDGFLYIAPTNGYETFGEAIRGLSRGHQTADALAAADEAGTDDPAIIAEYRASGFGSFDKFREAIDAGAERAFEEYRRAQPTLVPKAPPCRSLAEFAGRYFIDEVTSQRVGEVIEMVRFGASDLAIYRQAISGGFTNVTEAVAAKRAGFTDAAMYHRFRATAVDTRAQYEEFLRVEQGCLDAGYKSMLEYAIWDKAKETTPGSRVGILAIGNHVRSHTREYGLGRKGELPGLADLEADPSSLREIFESSAFLSDLCFYEDSRTTLRRRWFSRAEHRTVVLDVSNIAWTGRDREAGENATLVNVMIMVRALNRLSFQSMIGIADASLPYQIEESEQVDELKALVDLTLVPGNQSADPHILDVAKNRQALIVTNDQYREWADHDEWKRANLPRVLIPFEIRGEEVVFDEKTNELVVDSSTESRSE